MSPAGFVIQITSRSGTPSQSPMPFGEGTFRQVITFRYRTACSSAKRIRSSQPKAVPASFDSGFPILQLLSGSATTSSYQVSGVRPTSLRLSSGSRHGGGLPRPAKRNLFSGVR